jgi:Tfp pilus assembly protein PilF
MTASHPGRLILVVALTILVAACGAMRESSRKPAVPQITEAQLREKAKENLASGLRQYQLGNYDDAQKNLSASLDHGVLSKSDQSTARKHLAFIHCVSDRGQQCADEFRKAMEIDPGFDLTPAEAGHPSWGPVYRGVRAQLTGAATPEARPPRTAAERSLADGMAKYDAGEFNAALKLFQSALKEGLTDKSDQVKAHKQSAFSLCLLRRFTQCRSEFTKIFGIDPGFDLAPAEAGHPSWAKTYAGAKQRAKQAKEKTAKDAVKKK